MVQLEMEDQGSTLQKRTWDEVTVACCALIVPVRLAQRAILVRASGEHLESSQGRLLGNWEVPYHYRIDRHLVGRLASHSDRSKASKSPLQIGSGIV